MQQARFTADLCAPEARIKVNQRLLASEGPHSHRASLSGCPFCRAQTVLVCTEVMVEAGGSEWMVPGVLMGAGSGTHLAAKRIEL